VAGPLADWVPLKGTRVDGAAEASGRVTGATPPAGARVAGGLGVEEVGRDVPAGAVPDRAGAADDTAGRAVTGVVRVGLPFKDGDGDVAREAGGVPDTDP